MGKFFPIFAGNNRDRDTSKTMETPTGMATLPTAEAEKQPNQMETLYSYLAALHARHSDG